MLFWVLLEDGNSTKVRARDVLDAKEMVVEYLRDRGIRKRVTGVLRIESPVTAEPLKEAS